MLCSCFPRRGKACDFRASTQAMRGGSCSRPRRKIRFLALTNHPGFTGGLLFELCGHGRVLQRGVITFFGFGWRNVSDGLQRPTIVKPVRPFQRRELDVLEGAPRPAAMGHFGFV